MTTVNFNNLGIIRKKLSKETLDKLNNYIKVKKEKWNKNLIGQIHNSTLLIDKNDWFFENELLPCIQEYLDSCPKNGWIIPNTLNENLPFKLESMWVNFQKKYEFNPFHTHSGLFSFVVWMKIPADYEKEKKLPFVKHANCAYPNTFQMFYINSLGRMCTYDCHLSPDDEGTMLFFTANRPHQVYPFYTSNKTRVSISGNVVLNSRIIKHA